jgi:hypothetical protein
MTLAQVTVLKRAEDRKIVGRKMNAGRGLSVNISVRGFLQLT